MLRVIGGLALLSSSVVVPIEQPSAAAEKLQPVAGETDFCVDLDNSGPQPGTSFTIISGVVCKKGSDTLQLPTFRVDCAQQFSSAGINADLANDLLGWKPDHVKFGSVA